MRCIVAVCLGFATLNVAGAVAQDSTDSRFEVASVRPNKDATASGGYKGAPGRFTAISMRVFDLIHFAHQVDTTLKIVGAPDWTRRERFDITATRPVNTTPDENAAMLRALLAERFGLKAHRETRPMRVFVLSRVRPDGDLGPDIRSSTIVCGNPKPRCGERNSPRGSYRATGIQWPPYVLIYSELQLAVDAPVIDRTGITGRYDIDLEWADPTATVAAQAATADRPSLFTALRERLGLKLEPGTEPLEVLVIDSVQRPTPD